MRARALLGGAAIVAAVALWHRSPAGQAEQSRTKTGCAPAAPDSFCGAVTGLSAALHVTTLALPRAGILPPPETPGAIDPTITPANIDATICRPGYSRSVRPAYAITGPLKRRMMQAQHPGEPMADYELDHLIPISLGGAPLDPRDLWLQSRRGQANASDKNALAYILWRLVCEHRLPLATAQREISRDWTRAYDTYATAQNMARYRFRHGQADRD